MTALLEYLDLTALLEYIDLLNRYSGGPSWGLLGPLSGWGPGQNAPVAPPLWAALLTGYQKCGYFWEDNNSADSCLQFHMVDLAMGNYDEHPPPPRALGGSIHKIFGLLTLASYVFTSVVNTKHIAKIIN